MEVRPIGSVRTPWGRIRALTAAVLDAASFLRNLWYVLVVAHPLASAHCVFQSLVLNLGMSPGWQTIDLSTMSFPTEMLIDYVRIYQRKGHENIGCSPDDYPTEEYINNHMEAYTSELEVAYSCHQLLT